MNAEHNIRVSCGYSKNGSANENIVTISGGELSSVGGDVDVYGGYSEAGSANENKVYLTGGTLTVMLMFMVDMVIPLPVTIRYMLPEMSI